MGEADRGDGVGRGMVSREEGTGNGGRRGEGGGGGEEREMVLVSRGRGW